MNKFILMMCSVSLALSGCGDSKQESVSFDSNEIPSANTPLIENENTDTAPLIDFSDAALFFNAQAQAAVNAMLQRCSALQVTIQAFVADPTDTKQEEAQKAFRPCYQGWASASLFFQQPFDFSEENNFQILLDLIDTRPFLPGYIDGIPEYPYSGLVHELDLPITSDSLRGQHRLMDEESASVGFPVIEFFLWKTPVDQFWLIQDNKENEKTVERRQNYLATATELLLTHLTQATLRWRDNNRFAELPERAQLSLVLKSLQRLSMHDLLTHQFDSAVLQDPTAYHPASISGEGRAYSLAKLSAIQNIIGKETDTPFSLWLEKIAELSFTVAELRTAINKTIESVATLAPNYPFDSTEDEAWQKARLHLAQQALYFSQLSGHFKVAVVTE